MLRLLRRMALMTVVVGGAMAVVEWRRQRRAGKMPFGALRRLVNERVDPWLLRAGAVGGRHSEIATLEHVGRTTGTVRFTPVHATFAGDDVWIPLPYGDASQWARNVVAAGRCRLQLHETLHELDQPAIVAPSEDPLLAPPVQWAMNELSMRYLHLHRAASVPGTFAIHGDAAEVHSAVRTPEPPLDATFPLGPVEEPTPRTVGASA